MAGPVLSTPALIVNAALVAVGYKKYVGSLYDGSEQSRAALAIYGETRDEMLRAFDYGFAERDLTLTLLKTAPVQGYSPSRPWTAATDPLPPWIYQYTYPADCLKVRALRYIGCIPEYDPQAVEFRIANDNSYNPAKKVILTNLPSATLVYTAQVTDPTTWEASFTDALVEALGRKLASALVSMEETKPLAAEEAQATAEAEMRIG